MTLLTTKSMTQTLKKKTTRTWDLANYVIQQDIIYAVSDGKKLTQKK